MLNNIIQTVLCLIVIGYVGNAHAQNSTRDITQIKFLYNELRFEEAIHLGQKSLRGDDSLSPKHLEYIHRFIAYSFFNIGMLDSSRVYFLSLLSINPEIELDPVDTSPKIIDFFNKIKLNFQEINTSIKVFSYPKYVFIEDRRPDAAWRSALLPGWGQYYKGQPTRAYILSGAFLTSAVVLGVSLVNESKYKDQYLNSTDPEDINNNYDSYNNWSKIRRVSTYTTIGIWLLSFADALWSDYPKTDLNISGSINSDLSVLSIKYYF